MSRHMESPERASSEYDKYVPFRLEVFVPEMHVCRRTLHGTFNSGVGFQLWPKGSASRCISARHTTDIGLSVTVFGAGDRQHPVLVCFLVDACGVVYQQALYTSGELGFGSPRRSSLAITRFGLII